MNHDTDIIKWQPMIGISLGLHLGVLVLMIFLPGFLSLSPRVLPGTVYQVDLVSLSVGNGQKAKGGQTVYDKNKVLKPDLPAKRVSEDKIRAEEPIKIAKLTTIIKAEKEHDASSSELIKEAITKIEKEARTAKQAKQEEDRQIEEAIAGLKNKPITGSDSGAAQANAGVSGNPGGTPAAGSSLAMQIYQSEVERWIFSKWSYPVALSNQKDLAAVVELLVRANGSIEKSSFVKRSGNPVFDASVLKAIERANPLPPFPEGLRKSNDEFEINFDLTKVPQ
ncbi:MAG: TonB family protein [Desulfobacteraceae bacterium]|nr:MAG: TonB family protein [Desulfobacteraceae bacterium]